MTPDSRVLLHRSGRPPFPGCVCPAGYVRDELNGHPEKPCPFNGIFGLELAAAHFAAQHPDGQQLSLGAA